MSRTTKVISENNPKTRSFYIIWAVTGPKIAAAGRLTCDAHRQRAHSQQAQRTPHSAPREHRGHRVKSPSRHQSLAHGTRHPHSRTRITCRHAHLTLTTEGRTSPRIPPALPFDRGSCQLSWMRSEIKYIWSIATSGLNITAIKRCDSARGRGELASVATYSISGDSKASLVGGLLRQWGGRVARSRTPAHVRIRWALALGGERQEGSLFNFQIFILTSESCN